MYVYKLELPVVMCSAVSEIKGESVSNKSKKSYNFHSFARANALDNFRTQHFF